MKTTRQATATATEDVKIANRLDYYMRLPYEVEVGPDECDDQPCYMALHPELYGCMAQGDTPEEALSNLKAAREDYITALLEEGVEVPLPKNIATGA